MKCFRVWMISAVTVGGRGWLGRPARCADGLAQHVRLGGPGLPVVVQEALWDVVGGGDVPVGVGGDSWLVAVGLPVPGDDGGAVRLSVDADGIVVSHRVEQVVYPVLEVGPASGKVDDGEAHVVRVKYRALPVVGGDEVAPPGGCRTGWRRSRRLPCRGVGTRFLGVRWSCPR